MAKKQKAQSATNAKNNIKDSFSKKTPSLEFYDAGAMFIGQFILQYMLQLLMMIIAYFIIADLKGINPSLPGGSDKLQNEFTAFTATTAGLIIIVILNESTMLLSPLAYWKIKSFNVFKDVGFTRKINPAQIAMTLPVAIFLLAGFAPIANAFVELVQKTGYTYQGTNITVDSAGKLILYLIFVALLPAICEEIMHRGIIARAGSKISFFTGMILSSCIFALMHGSPVQLVHQFFVGVVCTLMYYMTGSIWISALTHFFNNAITLIVGYVTSKHTSLSIPWWGMTIICAVGLAGLFGCLYATYKICYVKRVKEDSELGLDSFEDKEAYKGKTKALKIFNQKFSYLFVSPEQRFKAEQERQSIEEQIADYSPEKKEVYYSMMQEDDVELKKKNSRAIIFAFVVVGVIWIFNTVIGYF